MVHDMVAAHTGQVLVERVEGQGTTVTGTLLHTTDALTSTPAS
jgi:signal transduction histidine kinase